MTDAPQVQLPKWKCHKEVYADKIVSISSEVRHIEDVDRCTLILACGAVITPDKNMFMRGRPILGDYYVLYEDGYQSWSPVKAFEEGYTRI